VAPVDSPFDSFDVSTMVDTGDGYDARTGSVRRTVTDIDVPGAVSSHGLKLVRSYSSTHNGGWFRGPSAWIVGSDAGAGQGVNIIFPDGRTMHFADATRNRCAFFADGWPAGRSSGQPPSGSCVSLRLEVEFYNGFG
jgi:hypothetical protein